VQAYPSLDIALDEYFTQLHRQKEDKAAKEHESSLDQVRQMSSILRIKEPYIAPKETY
jgi:hypothetical protein